MFTRRAPFVHPLPPLTLASTSPVGNYFKTKPIAGAKGTNGTSAPQAADSDDMLATVTPITLLASQQYVRSVHGSVGGVKAVGNYAPCFKGQKEARDAGFNDALFLDSKTGTEVEEAGASNFFAFFPKEGGGGTLVTPPLVSAHASTRSGEPRLPANQLRTSMLHH